ncbi:MAG: hypothetical protein RL154_1406 [Pseudomonadota bacterium]
MLKNLIKLAITIVIFVYLFGKINFEEVHKNIEIADIPLLLMALFLAICSTTLAAYRWGRVTKLLSLASGFKFYLTSYFKGSFFNQALPGSIGGDAVRMIDLKEMGFSWSKSFYAVFIDRVSGLMGLLLINALAIIAMPSILPSEISTSVLVVCFGGLSALIFLSIIRKISFLEKFKFFGRFIELSIAFRSVYHDKREILIQIGSSALVNFFSVLCVFALARAVRLEFDVWYYCVLMPPVFLATIIPISLAGWGVREGVMVTLFAYIGADSAKILTVAMLYGIVTIISSLPGAFVWLFEKRAI